MTGGLVCGVVAGGAVAVERLLRISDPGLAHVYQFAVRAPDGSERIVLTNVGSVARAIGVAASGTGGTGPLSLLRARSLDATKGTTLGGQNLSSRTGRLTGLQDVTLVGRTPVAYTESESQATPARFSRAPLGLRLYPDPTRATSIVQLGP